jgi:hypothetical protein
LAFGSPHDEGQAVDIDYQLLDMLLAFGIFVAAATRRSSMSTIDKQRIRKLEQLGYTFAGDDWMHPANDAAAIAPTITDELHAMLVKRADDLEAALRVRTKSVSSQPLSVRLERTKLSAGPQARSPAARADLRRRLLFSEPCRSAMA